MGARILGSAVSDEVSLLVWMQAMPEVAHDFLDREGGGRGLGVDQELTARGVHELARDAGGLLGLAL